MNSITQRREQLRHVFVPQEHARSTTRAALQMEHDIGCLWSHAKKGVGSTIHVRTYTHCLLLAARARLLPLQGGENGLRGRLLTVPPHLGLELLLRVAALRARLRLGIASVRAPTLPFRRQLGEMLLLGNALSLDTLVGTTLRWHGWCVCLLNRWVRKKM